MQIEFVALWEKSINDSVTLWISKTLLEQMIRTDPLLQIAALMTKYCTSHALAQYGKTASTRERRRPGGEGGPWPQTKKRALKALESGNALHERNGLSSHGLHRSTFGDGELNCRVRHGTG